MRPRALYAEVNRRSSRVLPYAAILMAVATLLTPASTMAGEIVLRNDNLPPGDPGFLVNPFQIGESVAAWLSVPADGRIVGVQFAWRSGSGGAPTSQEDSITVFDGGAFPVPGTSLAVIADPVLIDGELNEFRHLDSAMTMPLDVPVTAGQTIVVALKFANAPDVEPEGPGIIAELGDCPCATYSQFSVIAEPDAWVDVCCGAGFPGNLAIRAVLDVPEAVPTASTWGLAMMSGIMLIVATVLVRRPRTL